jgi:hypothetical protein
MRWLPPWLAKAYSRIYAQKKTGVFEFQEAAGILNIKDERPLAKVLTKLKTSGHLTVRRDPVDPRRKFFKLVDPESMTLAMAIQSMAKETDFRSKLRAASGFLDCYVTGAYAAYQYHRYLTPGKVQISVLPEQLGAWIALLSERDISISVDDVPAEKRSPVTIHLISDFDQKLSENTKVIDGIRHISPEAFIATDLASEMPSVEDIFAILVVQKSKLDWDRLFDLCSAYGTARYLGLMLDILNFESGKNIFKKEIIAKLLKKSDLRAKLDFPPNLKAQPTEPRYEEISSRWNIRSRVSYRIVSKVITDLVR